MKKRISRRNGELWTRHWLSFRRKDMQRLTEYIRDNMPDGDGEATLSPPAHLRDEIQKCRV